MPNRITDRIARKAGVPDLVEALAERLGASDLQSLLLEVYQQRASAGTPRDLAKHYAENRFVKPSAESPLELLEFDRIAYALLPPGFEAVELSPLAPLGTSSIVSGMSQNRIVSTVRNTEVAADSTNALALECAARREVLLRGAPRSTERVKLAASQRLVRAQAYEDPGLLAHFRLFGLCTAGRDEGSHRFETESLAEQVGFHLALLEAQREAGRRLGSMSLLLTPLEGGVPEAQLESEVLATLAEQHPSVDLRIEHERDTGLGYYVGACFWVYVEDPTGRSRQLVDGGLTTWTQQLSSSRKERLLISGIGTEAVVGLF